MQKDFHYHAIAVLARGVGFPAEDAETIAHASQYVDDSTESEPIPINCRGKVVSFEPVRTAHDLQRFSHLYHSVQWSEQKRVYLPFHFLPAEAFDAARCDKFSFLTRKDSPLARALVTEAFGETDPRRRLCALGIALHTYADSWSHAQFSGKTAKDENDVEAIEVFDEVKNAWQKLRTENLTFDLVPCIGHAQAECYPDRVSEHWKCKLPTGLLERNNRNYFLEAAECIYRLLSTMLGAGAVNPIRWADLKLRIERVFQHVPAKNLGQKILYSVYRLHLENELEERCKQWRTEFRDLFPKGFCYDRQTWRMKAFKGDTDWDKWLPDDWKKMAPRTPKAKFWDSHFVHFHRAALKQRHRVLECLP